MIIWLIRIPFILIALAVLTLLAIRLYVGLYAYQRTFDVASAPYKPAAVIFGAGLRRDGSPTAVLRDRVNKGVELYLAGKVDKLLMSGDNRTIYYDEPSAMKEYALGMGVAEEDIVLDYAGLRTYDTCYRARTIFGLREVVLVTQNFHLPRAVYTCNALGVEASGVAADRFSYRTFSLIYWNIRETIATAVAMLDVYITRPTPILGSPQPIFPPEV